VRDRHTPRTTRFTVGHCYSWSSPCRIMACFTRKCRNEQKVKKQQKRHYSHIPASSWERHRENLVFAAHISTFMTLDTADFLLFLLGLMPDLPGFEQKVEKW